MKKSLLLLMLLTLGTWTAMAQGTVRGKVTSSEDGTGIPGVSVLVKGSSTGTQTDAEGNYSIKAEASASLEFSFIGFKTVTEKVGNRTTINVALDADVKTLSRVS